ncbi:helicase RepA family protein, partial [Xanthomonas perforans]|uniref:AAA family ATPase n=1 Tax=Xanthomonas perforans TaxID=442694 RepID=UPI001F230721
MAIDVLAAFECEPPVLDFIWPGFLAGTVGALVAPGATGKSFWALEAAMSIAS